MTARSKEMTSFSSRGGQVKDVISKFVLNKFYIVSACLVGRQVVRQVCGYRFLDLYRSLIISDSCCHEVVRDSQIKEHKELE
jgi:hypothetical protein